MLSLLCRIFKIFFVTIREAIFRYGVKRETQKVWKIETEYTGTE